MSVCATKLEVNGLQLKSEASEFVRCVTIASTFTAEPVEDSLAFWLDELGQRTSIKFAPTTRFFSSSSIQGVCWQLIGRASIS